MGWSATKQACETMDSITKVLEQEFETQNGWIAEDGSRYFWERGADFTLKGREHPDGHISVSVYRVVSNQCHRIGSIYIDPNGVILRWPASLKRIFERRTRS